MYHHTKNDVSMSITLKVLSLTDRYKQTLQKHHIPAYAGDKYYIYMHLGPSFNEEIYADSEN